MGQTPAKMFPSPTPYGSSPDSNVLMQAQAAPLAPAQSFLPLNPSTPQTQQAQTQPKIQQMYGGYGVGRLPRLAGRANLMTGMLND